MTETVANDQNVVLSLSNDVDASTGKHDLFAGSRWATAIYTVVRGRVKLAANGMLHI